MTKLYTAKEWAGIPEIGEAAAPAKIATLPLLECMVQKQCVDWARKRGYWARKFSSMSQRSVPDYLFARWISEPDATPKRLKFWTEFKREGHEVDPETGLMSTKAQIEEQKAMCAAGWIGFECSDFEVFKHEVERAELTCYTTEAWREPK